MRSLLLLLLLTLPCCADPLSVSLYQKLAERGGNVFFSPYSIRMALAMAMGGARGETRAELEALVGDVKAVPGLDQGNRVWVEATRPLLPEFVRFTAGLGAEATRVNFRTGAEEARKTINNWVASATRDKVRDLLPEGSLDALTTLVLTNAVYFKRDWKHAFSPEQSGPAPFFGAGEVRMMRQTAEFAYAKVPGAAVCELPYQGEFVMDVVLPDENEGLPALEKGLALESYLLALQPGKVHVELPAFKHESKYALKEQLQALGLKLSFSNTADFSGMTGTNDLKLGQVFHGGFIEVNEKGTEAAAATAVTVVLRNGHGPAIPVFRCDHPFLYLIRHQPSGTIVFMGRFAKP